MNRQGNTLAVLDDLSQLSGIHLAELSADLAQTGDLLRAAIVHLLAEFNGLNQALSEQQALLEQAPSDCRARLAALAAEAQGRVHAMVTGLQFEDMTRQLIDRSHSRAVGLAGMLATLQQQGPGTDSEALRAQLHQASQALFVSLQKSVPQQHMRGGEVDLF